MLEVLVALVIAALAFGVLFQAATDGVNAVRTAGLYSTALALARSRLALVGASPLREQSTEGADGVLHWRVRVTPAGVSAPPAGLLDRVRRSREMIPVLYHVTVVVGWNARGAPRRVTLETSRLGFDAPQPGGP